jgi:hypothetical protein
MRVDQIQGAKLTFNFNDIASKAVDFVFYRSDSFGDQDRARQATFSDHWGRKGNNKMAEKHLVVAVDWSGPYSLGEARQVAAKDFDGGLYLCLGKLKGNTESNRSM